MSDHVRGYRALLVLYPRDFRREFGPDLTQAFGDLSRHRGAWSAWGRGATDLATTVPRYRMESLMGRPRSSLAVTTIHVLVALAAVVMLVMGSVGTVVPLAGAAVLGRVAAHCFVSAAGPAARQR